MTLALALSLCLETLGRNPTDAAKERLAALCEELPSGSGVDHGTKLDVRSLPTKLIFTCGFHHMDAHGCYDGWTDHEIVVTPRFASFDVNVKGRNRNDIKSYLGDLFWAALSTEVAA